MLFKHSSGERQRPEPGSLAEAELVAKAADPTSGWQVIDEDQTHTTEDGNTRLVKHRPAPGRRNPRRAGEAAADVATVEEADTDG